MPTVCFRAKIINVYNLDDTLAYAFVKVPKLERKHCDIDAFRKHPQFGAFANSDMFPSVLKRALKGAGIDERIRLDKLPECVSIDTSGFLAKVTIKL